MGLAHDDKIYALKIRESATDGSDFSNPVADYRMLYLGEDGFLHVKDSAGAVTDPYDVSGASGVGAMWQMVKNNTAQTLTNNTSDQITFEAAGVDSGGSVIDLANDRFVVPATGLYLAILHWRWGSATVPSASAHMTPRVAAAEVTYRKSPDGTPTASTAQNLNATFPLTLTSGGFVTMYINPGAVTGATAEGSASVQLQTSFTLVRVT